MRSKVSNTTTDPTVNGKCFGLWSSMSFAEQYSNTYKYVSRIHAYPKAPPDIFTPINMEDQAQYQIYRILDLVRSLDDLSADDVNELRRISEQSIIIDKFKISTAEYFDWYYNKVGDEIRGVEYDAQNACIILKGGPGWMHEAATDVTRVFLNEIRNKLSEITGSRYALTGSMGMLIDLFPHIS